MAVAGARFIIRPLITSDRPWSAIRPIGEVAIAGRSTPTGLVAGGAACRERL